MRKNAMSATSNVIRPLLLPMIMLLVITTFYSGLVLPVSAQEPPVKALPNPITKGINVTSPVTGSAPSSAALDSGNGNILADSASLADEELKGNKEYTKFEVRQVAISSISGSLEIEGNGYSKSVPYSAGNGDPFSVFAILDHGQTGSYEVKLTHDSHDEPLMLVNGVLDQMADGEYRHQFLGATADPEFLELVPEEAGLIISVGSVKAKLASCLDLNEPIDGTYELGVDQNGDTKIDPSESTIIPLHSVSQRCIETPEANIPLTSNYNARVTMVNGTIVAQNTVLYDFLNKSGVESAKETLTDLVKEFKVEWSRIPVAASISIFNNSIRPPAVDFIAIPEVEEVTGDIIENSPDDNPTSNEIVEENAPEIAAPLALDDNSLFDFLVAHWVWMALGLSGIVALGIVIKGAYPKS